MAPWWKQQKKRRRANANPENRPTSSRSRRVRCLMAPREKIFEPPILFPPTPLIATSRKWLLGKFVQSQFGEVRKAVRCAVTPPRKLFSEFCHCPHTTVTATVHFWYSLSQTQAPKAEGCASWTNANCCSLIIINADRGSLILNTVETFAHSWSPVFWSELSEFNAIIKYRCCFLILIISVSLLHLYPPCIFILVASLSSLSLYLHFIVILVASLSSLHLDPHCILILLTLYCCWLLQTSQAETMSDSVTH